MSEFERYRADYERDGFVVVRRFLVGAAFEELGVELDRYIAEVVPGLSDSAAFYQDRSRPETLKQMQHMGGDPYFESYRQHPRWNELAETLMGEPVKAQQPEWFNKPPLTEHSTPPHQDNFYINLDPPPLTLWLALDPVDEQNGCLRYGRGSNRAGLRPHGRSHVLGFSQGITDFGPDDEAVEQAICLEPGDMAVHHGELIHRADPNTTGDRQRRAFAMVFYSQSARRDERAHERYLAQVREQHSGMGLQVEE